jgi:hypothetical protein
VSKKSGDEYICPLCGKSAERNEMIGNRKHTVSIYVVPYFICGACRLLYISKRLIRESMHSWWVMVKLKEQVPFKCVYKEAIETLENIVVKSLKEIGYRMARFKKNSR